MIIGRAEKDLESAYESIENLLIENGKLKTALLAISILNVKYTSRYSFEVKAKSIAKDALNI